MRVKISSTRIRSQPFLHKSESLPAGDLASAVRRILGACEAIIQISSAGCFFSNYGCATPLHQVQKQEG
jgi:hypothetical protein